MPSFSDILALPSELSGTPAPRQGAGAPATAKASSGAADVFAGILALPSRWMDSARAAPATAAAPPPAPAAGGALPRMAAISFKDPRWDASETAAHQKTGVPVEVLRAIRLHGERSNGDQISPKGARGVYQFIPSTRAAFLKKYGVDAYSADPNEQAMATALHLKESYARTKDWARAMAGFNGGISGERGTNKTGENAAYLERTKRAIDPMNISAADEFSDAWQRDAFALQDPQELNQNLA